MIDYNPRLNRYHVRLRMSFGDLVLGYFSSYDEALQALRIEQMRQEGSGVSLPRGLPSRV